MLLSKNLIISAVAGAGKTSRIVEEGCVCINKKILYTTYTNNNTNNIKAKIKKKYGFIPNNIDIAPWDTFLLDNWVRPYANLVFPSIKSPPSLFMINGRSQLRTKKDAQSHYFSDDGDIYSDKLSEFGFYCNGVTGGKNIIRLAEIYDRIYVDEVQDLTGYDLEILSLIFKSDIETVIVGDSNQNVYNTNASTYMKKQSLDVIGWAKDTFRSNTSYIELNKTYRCSANVCDFVTKIFPDLNIVPALFNEIMDKDIITNFGDLEDYIDNKEKINKKVLILGSNYKCDPGIGWYSNFRTSKGLEADCVVIILTKDYNKYLSDPSKLNLIQRRVLYVAVTRARDEIVFYNPNCKKNKKSCVKNNHSIQKTLF